MKEIRMDWETYTYELARAENKGFREGRENRFEPVIDYLKSDLTIKEFFLEWYEEDVVIPEWRELIIALGREDELKMPIKEKNND